MTSHDSIETSDGLILKEPKQIVDALNQHFLDIGETLNDEQLIRRNSHPRSNTTEYECHSSIHLSKLNEHGIRGKAHQMIQ